VGHRHLYLADFQANRPHIADVLHSLVSDYQCFLDFTDMMDFIQEFGYTDLKEGRKVFRQLQINAEKMENLFTQMMLRWW
jgi:hypothetical protein